MNKLAIHWHDPEEIEDADAGESCDEPEAQPFPLHCLPASVREMARAIAGTERTPESLAGCCTLGILSASIGRGLQIQSGPDRFTRGNLYLAGSAQSGSGKSETFRHAARPFMEFESETLERWNLETLPGLAAEKDILEAEIGKLKKRAFNSAGADGAEERGEIKAQLEQKKAQLAALKGTMHAPGPPIDQGNEGSRLVSSVNVNELSNCAKSCLIYHCEMLDCLCADLLRDIGFDCIANLRKRRRFP